MVGWVRMIRDGRGGRTLSFLSAVLWVHKNKEVEEEHSSHKLHRLAIRLCHEQR